MEKQIFEEIGQEEKMPPNKVPSVGLDKDGDAKTLPLKTARKPKSTKSPSDEVAAITVVENPLHTEAEPLPLKKARKPKSTKSPLDELAAIAVTESPLHTEAEALPLKKARKPKGVKSPLDEVAAIAVTESPLHAVAEVVATASPLDEVAAFAVAENPLDEVAQVAVAETKSDEVVAFAVAESLLEKEQTLPEVVLQAVGLTKRYTTRRGGSKSELCALDNVSFSVSAGEVVGFLGPNGAGKSTAIKLITGLAEMTAGSATILGHDIKTDRRAALLYVGGVIEQPDLYKDMTALSLLRYFAGLYPKSVFLTDGQTDYKNAVTMRINKLLQLVGLTTRKNDLVKTFSLGMKQRLGIAQALLNKPRLLLLDEPANGLDPSGIKEIRDIIIALAKEMNMAVLVSSHQLKEVEEMCDRVIILNHGKIAAEGMPSTLLSGTKKKIRIKTLEQERAVSVFYGKENVLALKERDGILVSGVINAGDAAKMLVLAGVPFTGISEDAGSLEDIFFRVTEGGAN